MSIGFSFPARRIFLLFAHDGAFPPAQSPREIPPMPHRRSAPVRRLFVACTAVLLLLLRFTITADEGMYPLSEIARINLKVKGLKIPVREIYNPDGVSLV